MRKIRIKDTVGAPIKVKKTLQPVKKGEPSNLEAEQGEVAISPLNHMGFPELYVIGGKKHSQGGSKLNLPENSFIFSHDPSMHIKNPSIQEDFDKKAKKKGLSPADVAKQYDINAYLKDLVDPNADKMQKETAEQMIKNYNFKLGKLALVQESMKGFPDGLPFVANPYLSEMNMDPAQLVRGSGKDEPVDVDQDQTMMDVGGGVKIKITGKKMQKGGDAKSEIARRKKHEEQFQAEQALYMQKKEAEDEAKYRARKNEDDAVRLDNQSNVENTRLRQQFDRVQSTGPSAWDFLPFVSSSEKELEAFNTLARQYGKNPDQVYNELLNSKNKGNKLENFMQKRQETKIVEKPAGTSPWEGKIRNKDYRVIGNDTIPIEEKFKFDTGGTKTNPKPVKETSQGILYSDGTLRDYKGNIVGAAPAGKTGSKPASQNTIPSTKKTSQNSVGLESVYSDTALSNMEKAKAMGMNLTIPETVKEQQGAVKKIQGRLPNNVYGRRNWASAELMPDFANRARWYMKDHPDFDPRKPEDVKAFQKAYNNRLVTFGLAPELNEDSKFGEKTYSIYDLNKGPQAPAAAEPVNTIAPELADITAPEVKFAQKKTAAPGEFWQQDVNNMIGAWGDYNSIKKYMPWQAGYQTLTPNPTYFDPTRELGSNSEQAVISGDVLSQFAGPQETSSRLSSVQGQALSNAANIIGKYNNLNVGVANEFEQMKTGILNQDSLNRANMATALFDKTTIANQQFDNAKRESRAKILDSLNTAWTNRGKTQALNSFQKQYQVDPRTGYVNFTGVPGRLDKTPNNKKDVMGIFDEIMSNPNLRSDPATAGKLALKMAGMPDNEDEDVMSQYLRNYNSVAPR